MEITSYRLVKPLHAASAFDGEGARLYGGRWNSVGVPMVYTSESLALCCLEILVHLPSYHVLQDYVYMQVSFDSDLAVDARLVEGWDVKPVSKISQSTGDQWVSDNVSPILRVPSAIIPDGVNYLLNIFHPEFDRVRIGDQLEMTFDSRLKKT